MLQPRYLDRLPDRMVELYGLAEADILADMAQRIAAFGDFIPAAQWQFRKLLEMGNLHDEIIKRLSKLTGMTKRELKRLMDEAGAETLRTDDGIYRKAGLTPTSLASSPALQSVVDAGLQKTLGLFDNLTSTTANTAARQFERVLDRAYMQVTSGAFSRTEAIKMAVKNLCEKGVAAVIYPSGHTDYIDVAVRRAVLTGVNQTALKLQDARADEMGCDLVEVTAHAGARHTGTGPANHSEWQGKIYSRSGKHPKYPDFMSSTGYGTGEGLGGWNCRHSYFPFIEGVSVPAYTQAELDSMNAKNYKYDGQTLTEYEATQRQRQIERNIRRWKREYKAMEAAGLPTYEAAGKLSKWQEVQKDFLKQTGLKRQYDRESVEGWGRHEAGRASMDARQLNNPTEYPEQAFTHNLQSNKITDQAYADALKRRFDAGTRNGKKAFAKLVPEGSVADGAYTGTAHYSRSTKKIQMSYADDAINKRGPGATFFHEHGHLVDCSGGELISVQVKAFDEALRKDCDSYIMAYMQKNGIDRTAAYTAISAELQTSDMNSAVSDIMGGLSGGNIRGGWGHTARYWTIDPSHIAAESFAHLFEAQFSEERLRLFRQYFPTASDEFDIILEGLI